MDDIAEYHRTQASSSAKTEFKDAAVFGLGYIGLPTAALIASRGIHVLGIDINEEVVRLKGHVIALSQALREREPVGKKIDFLLQEVQRELNTISSKVPQLAVVQLVLEGKERVEKIREQTQNIE